MSTADLIIRQGDTVPTLSLTVLDQNNNPLNLTGASPYFAMRALSSTTYTTYALMTIVNATAGQVSYSWSTADTQTAGIFMGEIHVSGGSIGGTYTFPNDGYLDIVIEENIISPGGQQLVSVGDAKDYLNIPYNDRSHDAKLVRFINAMQPIVEQITGPIIQQTYEEWYTGGNANIRLRRRPSTGYGTSAVMYLQAVSEYRGPIEYTLSIIQDPSFGSIYSCMLDSPRSGTIWRRTAGGGIIAFPAMPQSVHVWYTSGQSTVPANVYEACLELIRINYQKTQQAGPSSWGSNGIGLEDDVPNTPPMGFLVPGRVREFLAPNRKHPTII